MSFKSKRVVPWLFLHACHSVHILKPKGTCHHAANVRFNALWWPTLHTSTASSYSPVQLRNKFVEIWWGWEGGGGGGGVSIFVSKWILVYSVCSDDSSQCWWHSEDISTSDFGQVSSDSALLTVISFDWSWLWHRRNWCDWVTIAVLNWALLLFVLLLFVWLLSHVVSVFAQVCRWGW